MPAVMYPQPPPTERMHVVCVCACGRAGGLAHGQAGGRACTSRQTMREVGGGGQSHSMSLWYP